MKINMKAAFIIAVALHAILLGVLLIRFSLDKPTKPNMGQGDIMHATFVPPAKGNPNGTAKAAPAPAPAPVSEPAPLTQEELDHIAYIQKMAEQSSFEAVVPKADVVAEQERLDILPKADSFEHEEHSSATSGADGERSSFGQEAFDRGLGYAYERS